VRKLYPTAVNGQKVKHMIHDLGMFASEIIEQTLNYEAWADKPGAVQSLDEITMIVDRGDTNVYEITIKRVPRSEFDAAFAQRLIDEPEIAGTEYDDDDYTPLSTDVSPVEPDERP
jgi:hypothetical protein